MRNYLQYLLFFIVLASSFELLGYTSFSAQYDFYKKGLEYKNSGDWIQALDTWLAGRQILQQQGISDPRIGIAFIELATEQKLTQYYELACDMYFWGLSQNNLTEFKKDIEKEMARIGPLLDKKQYKEWRLLWQQSDPLLYERIKSFWLEKDPTPSTEINERLLEHWERIAYARKNFRKANTTAYRTDDRGLIYVKYGKPERKRTGVLGTNRAVLKRWSDVVLDNIVSPVGAAMRNRAVQQTLLLEAVDRFNNLPEYEIWFYHSLNSDEPIFYLFGNLEGVGSFGLRNGVEDLIPDRAFIRATTRYSSGVLPGAILQSVYYSELTHLHPYFEDRFYDLESQWNALDRGGASAMLRFNNTVRSKRLFFEGVDRVYQANAFAPPDKSNFDETVSEVELVIHPFRFLDDKNKPMLALITLSYPKIKIKFLHPTANKIVTEYSVTNTLIVHDKNKKEIQRLTESVPTGYDNTSTFILPHEENQYEYLLFAEVFNLETNKPDLAQLSQPEVSPQVIGIGKKKISRTSPLSTSTEMLELSDLIIGVNMPNESQNDRLPFPVVPSHKIWASDLLKIYLEIYHLYFKPDGRAHFVIDFEAVKIKGKKKSKKESISLSFNFDSPYRTSKEHFEIDVSNLTPGNYELLVTVTDTVSLQKKQRKAAFEIIKEVQKSGNSRIQ
ncbi:MAG: GWxTD domain-containing protein [bacterium]